MCKGEEVGRARRIDHLACSNFYSIVGEEK